MPAVILEAESEREMMNNFEDIIYEKRDGAAWITFNRPKVFNAIRLKMLKELIIALEDADSDKSLASVVATGKGEAFCAGGDLSLFKDFSQEDGRAMTAQCLKLANLMRGMGKPVIAAINGFCMGWGLEFVVFCDLAIAADNAQFEQTELRVGSCPMFGATQMFPLIMGDKRAREAIFLSKRYNAEEAERFGLINRVVAKDKLEEEVQAWCKRLLGMGPQSVRTAKVALGVLPDLMHSALRHGLALAPMLWNSPESKEAMAAFVEKRQPDFSQFRK